MTFIVNKCPGGNQMKLITRSQMDDLDTAQDYKLFGRLIVLTYQNLLPTQEHFYFGIGSFDVFSIDYYPNSTCGDNAVEEVTFNIGPISIELRRWAKPQQRYFHIHTGLVNTCAITACFGNVMIMYSNYYSIFGFMRKQFRNLVLRLKGEY